MTRTSHPLGAAIGGARVSSSAMRYEPAILRIARAYECAGIAFQHAHHNRLIGARVHLDITAGNCARTAAKIAGVTFAEIAADMRAEYDRANTKHDGNTPLNPAMSDEHRAAILMEELGEVARCLTPDADTPTGHAGDLYAELIQAATMAAAWSQHITNTLKKEHNR